MVSPTTPPVRCSPFAGTIARRSSPRLAKSAPGGYKQLMLAGPIELAPGTALGGYRIEGVAGRGGMGVVYRARQLRPERMVALKVINPELARDPTFRARFELEANIAASIEHPNVLPIYEFGEENGVLYLTMRWVEGTDMRQLLMRDRALEPVRATRIVEQVADALDAAHASGLVHRDVKPGNIL